MKAIEEFSFDFKFHGLPLNIDCCSDVNINYDITGVFMRQNGGLVIMDDLDTDALAAYDGFEEAVRDAYFEHLRDLQDEALEREAERKGLNHERY